MSRWFWFSICAILGLVMLVCGLLVPAHLRAVDASILQKAGRKTPTLVARGLDLAGANRLGAAQMLAQQARDENLPGTDKLEGSVGALAREHPDWAVWGGPVPRFGILFDTTPKQPEARPEPFTAYVIREENRDRTLEFLGQLERPGLKELLHFRTLTNTVLFSPSQSSSGQALDAALAICGLLYEEGQFSTALSQDLLGLAGEANLGHSQHYEQALLDLLSLGQRLNWDQLAAFVRPIEDPETLRLLTGVIRKDGAQLPLIFSAIQLSGQPAQVAQYLMNFSQTGTKDLGASLRFGAGALKELMQRNQRLYASALRQEVATYDPFGSFFSLAADYAWIAPWLTLAEKFLLYFSAGFLLAAALHFRRPAVSALEQPLQVRGFHVAREILFGLGFLLVVLLLSEPFLTQESQRVEFPFRLRLSMVGSVVPVGTNSVKLLFMNPVSLLTLSLFFVLQALLYTACLFKLGEIRRQQVPARMKLRLLENEDHLFDAGLYLGFAGTIISLILVSLGITHFSLMAAYSSTSFGIIFVSIFKIFNLRPVRRILLLEAEAASISAESVAPAGRPSFATSS